MTETYQERLQRLGIFDIKYDKFDKERLFEEFQLPWHLNFTSETKDHYVITTNNNKTVMISHNVNLLSFIVENANKYLE